MDDLYRRAPLMRFPLGASLELVYFPLQGVARVLSPAQVNSACLLYSQFRDVRSPDLAELEKCGMVVSLTELFERLGGCEVANSKQIAWLAIPTCNRPAELRRALHTYLMNFSRFERRPQILVADDSPAEGDALLAKQGFRILYVGSHQRRKLVELLAEGGEIPRDVLEFGLTPSEQMTRTGANRNTILLYTAGQMVLMADDDTICEPCFAPEQSHQPPLRLTSETDPTEFWFFADREAARSAAHLADFDILSKHEELLGRSVPSILLEAGANSDVAGLCDHLLRSLWSGTGRIAVTSSGCVGDCGMHSGRGLRYHQGCGTRGRITASDCCYRMALSSREVIRQAPAVTICHGSPFCAMFAGLDNRECLPPFLPICRNQDSVFASILNCCAPGSYLGYLPWSLVHDPSVRREYDTSGAARMSEIVIACVSGWKPPSSTSVEPRLQSLGTYLSDIASGTPAEFRETTLLALWRLAAQRVARAEFSLKRFGHSPLFWAADAERDIQSIAAATAHPDFGVPCDLCGDKQERLKRAQLVVRQYGRLLYWWPAIFAKAAYLSANSQLPVRI